MQRAPASGPRLSTVTRIRMSSGAALAYSTVDVEVAVVVEHAGVERARYSGSSLPRRRFSSTSARVRERRLRVLVEHPHVGVRRRAVEVVVELLDVLAVVALARWSGRTAAPSGSGRARSRARAARHSAGGRRRSRRCRPRPSDRRGCARGRAGNSPRPCRRAVVLAHRAPLPLAEVGPPALASAALSAFAPGGGPPRSRCRCVLRRPRTSCHRGIGVTRDRPSLRARASIARTRSSSPSDQAWNGQPPGVCGASPSAISRDMAEARRRRDARAAAARKRSRASCFAPRRAPRTRARPPRTGPISQGQTVPW